MVEEVAPLLVLAVATLDIRFQTASLVALLLVVPTLNV